MRTLDEVIKGFECCKEVGCNDCPYKILFDDDSHVPCDQFEKDDDALQWLKGYQKHIELDKLRDKYGVTSQKLRNTSQITCPKCHSEFVILPESNNALTWSELKQMERKPVWVEYNLHLSDKDARSRSRMWIIVQKIMPWRQDDELIYYSGFVFGKKEIGKTWQAYIKERE